MPYYDDDGNELNPDLISKPSLCVGCVLNEIEDDEENILCNLTRFDQSDGKEFVCFGFKQKHS